MQIIQIVPRLPPSIDGVGDYAFLLARQLRAAHDIHTQFVVCDPNWKRADIGKLESRNSKSTSPHPSPQGGEEALPATLNSQPSTTLEGFRIHQSKERSGAELSRVLSQPGMPTSVLLQYVGYGYQKRGCPVWLARALQAWKTENRSHKSAPTSDLQSPTSSLSAERRLVTMFHEISASGPVWSSAFWTSPVQRGIAKSLARLSSHCLTNMNLYARILKKLTARQESDYTVLPVFSNVGEPEDLPDWNERQPRMVVFGSAGERRKIYLNHKTDLEKACVAMGLEEIVDIGAAVEIPQLSVRVIKRGILPAPDVSREMLAARAGFFAYPVTYLGKSGIFAAYAAHGLAPVTFDENRIKNEDGLILDAHFVTANSWQGLHVNQLENIGKNARKWYDGHSLQKDAEVFADKI